MNFHEHLLAALLIQAIIGTTTRNWWAGAALASAYFIGREVAQAEYRWIELLSAGRRANMPWWGPFDPRVWQRPDQFADWLAPLAGTCLLAWWMTRHRT